MTIYMLPNNCWLSLKFIAVKDFCCDVFFFFFFSPGHFGWNGHCNTIFGGDDLLV